MWNLEKGVVKFFANFYFNYAYKGHKIVTCVTFHKKNNHRNSFFCVCELGGGAWEGGHEFSHGVVLLRVGA